MKITILGTRGEIEESARLHSKHSGVLIDNRLLLDCGEPVFLKHNPSHILITHLHPDHAFFVRSGDFEQIDTPIYAPEKYKTLPITVKQSSFTIGGYKITPIPTLHSAKVKSNAYVIEHGQKKILYTGDMIWIEKKYHKLLYNFDLVITEASHMRKGGLVRRDKKTGAIYGHTGVPNLIALFKQYTHTIVLTHFGAWFYHDIKAARKEIQALARQNEVEIIVGYDGLQLTI
jgi:ribonuclease BN (tRNA processing enzyme)